MRRGLPTREASPVPRTRESRSQGEGKGVYDELEPVLRDYVDRLLAHAETALWPERREALASFWRGIAQCEADDHEALATALGIELPEDADAAEIIFRLVLTAYIERLGASEVTNPDQAVLYGLSLEDAHAELAESWFAAHPEHLAALS